MAKSWKLSQLLLFIIAVITLSILIPTAVYADHQFEPGVSGFTKARTIPQQSILVWKDSRLTINIPDVIAPWNNMAGWQLFKQTSTETGANIVFKPASATWVEAKPTYRQPYTLCIIHSSGNSTHMYRHEIGHCLGFSDHIWKILLSDPKYNNPDLYGEIKICDDPSHPQYSPYKGVMSYCDWGYPWLWFIDDDRQMLARAGYMKQTTPTPTPTPTPAPTRTPTSTPAPTPTSTVTPPPAPTPTPTPTPSTVTPTPTPTPTSWRCIRWPQLCR